MAKLQIKILDEMTLSHPNLKTIEMNGIITIQTFSGDAKNFQKLLFKTGMKDDQYKMVETPFYNEVDASITDFIDGELPLLNKELLFDADCEGIKGFSGMFWGEVISLEQ